MRSSSWAVTAAASATLAHAASNSTLTDICTTAYVQSMLPNSEAVGLAISIDSTSVTANAHWRGILSRRIIHYCNVTFSYSHNGKDDTVLLEYWIPAPSQFQNRYLLTGGGGYAINSADDSLPGGIICGASAGITDGGFGGFSTNFDTTFPVVNGTANWDTLYMFGYQAHKELSLIGKQFTKNFFAMGEKKLYAYYQGCSEGAREGWSQVQPFGEEWDGAITGAPAMRYSFQQINHLVSNVIEKTVGYYPPICEMTKIMNATIEACDPMDGKTDGVVARSDLCKLNFNLNSTIGLPYYCPAEAAVAGYKNKRQLAQAATPEQNGTVAAEAVEIASQILDGLKDSEGRRVYLSYQPGASFADAETAYNFDTDTWELSISALGQEFPVRFIELQDSPTLTSLDNVTYDTLREWMYVGWQMYEDSLHTAWPDLSEFQKAGGKVLHFHGESDNSIPTAASVRYHESVREIMYPNMPFNESTAALNEWYQLYLVPGAGHCSTNDYQPNGPFPQTNLAVLIDWVENGNTPTTLNATHLAGANVGENAQLCAWPLRPMWKQNGTVMDCEYDQASIDSWLYEFDSFKMPVY
ncbi:tannase protein [Rutstroemia sp. NJR-2017a BBW]|nr:tannase protein [Rutstroemia sp. NJR-2017a BBW]